MIGLLCRLPPLFRDGKSYARALWPGGTLQHPCPLPVRWHAGDVLWRNLERLVENTAEKKEVAAETILVTAAARAFRGDGRPFGCPR